MYIGLCYEEVVKGEFMFSPLMEMLGALHVLSNPAHHLSRLEWVERVSTQLEEGLLEKIKGLGELTNQYLIIMDFAQLFPYRELAIEDALKELENLKLYSFNKIFKDYSKTISIKEKNNLIDLLRIFYEVYFQKEIKFLQPFLVHILKKEWKHCEKEGVYNYVQRIHERIEVDECAISFYKNKVYRYEKKEIERIVITASTFMSPHLLLGVEGKTLYLTKLIEVENKKDKAPLDLVKTLKALADENRLRILREIGETEESTQSLAKKLGITEAGISKHLKLLQEAALVEKRRQGNYLFYFLKKEEIDYIPYKLYEYIMRNGYN